MFLLGSQSECGWDGRYPRKIIWIHRCFLGILRIQSCKGRLVWLAFTKIRKGFKWKWFKWKCPETGCKWLLGITQQKESLWYYFAPPGRVTSEHKRGVRRTAVTTAQTNGMWITTDLVYRYTLVILYNHPGLLFFAPYYCTIWVFPKMVVPPNHPF